MLKDLLNLTSTRKVIAPISGGTDDTAIVGQYIDHQNFESAQYEIASGIISDAAATFTPLLEESDDHVTFTPVADSDMISMSDTLAAEAAATLTQANDGEVRRIGYKGNKRYTRLTITPAGNGAAWLIQALCVLGYPRVAPATQPAS